jgi:uncharacterized protein
MSVIATPLRLDTTACNRCGRCTPSCKPRALRIGPGYIFVDWEKCTGCAACADACDQGAILRREVKAPAADTRAAAAAPSGRKHAARSAKPAKARTPRALTPDAGPVAWSLPEGGLALAVAFALLVSVQALTGMIAGVPLLRGLTLVGYDAVIAGLLWYLARRHESGAPAAYRLDAWPEPTSAALAVGVAVACWLISMTYRAGVLAVGLRPPASEGADLTGLFGPGVLGVAITVALVAVVGPVLEEALLRGVVLQAVQRRFGAWPAIIVSALAFALLHASLWSLLPLTVLGVGLGWLASRSRSLWPAVIAHVLYNGVLVAAALYAAVH